MNIIYAIDVWNDSDSAAIFEIRRGEVTLIRGVVQAAIESTVRRQRLGRGVMRAIFGHRRERLPGRFHWESPTFTLQEYKDGEIAGHSDNPGLRFEFHR
jgi:hypothetical protein